MNLSNIIQSIIIHKMRKLNLGTLGLSSTDAQSISNLLSQRLRIIENRLRGINNYSVELQFGGRSLVKVPAKPLPETVVELLKEKGEIAGVIAYLMENIKGKKEQLEGIRLQSYDDYPEEPQKPVYIAPDAKFPVTETWGEDKLTIDEYNEYLQQEALAAHIGQFIHKDSPLDRLRTELPDIETLQWEHVRVGGGTDSYPLTINIHHSDTQLESIHTELAGLHRTAEKRVNYFKAKIKNAVTEENLLRTTHNQQENLRVSTINSGLKAAYDTLVAAWKSSYDTVENRHIKEQEEEIRRISGLKIVVDDRFKNIIDEYALKLS